MSVASRATPRLNFLKKMDEMLADRRKFMLGGAKRVRHVAHIRFFLTLLWFTTVRHGPPRGSTGQVHHDQTAKQSCSQTCGTGAWDGQSSCCLILMGLQ